MVLQDLGDTPSEDFNDNPYSSDSDPYSALSTSSSRRFDASQLPQPLPILGPFMGFTERNIRTKTEQTIKFAESRIHRPMTADETQALAGHLYKMEQTKSYFNAVGVAIGTWRAYNTMSVNRYPFYLPKAGSVDPNKFLFIRGPLAQYSRHSWRVVLYMFVAGEMGRIIGQLIGQPVAAQSTMADPRLAQFGEDLKGQMAADTQRGRSERARIEKENEEFMARSRRERMSKQQDHFPPRTARRSPPATPPATSEDDMSPTTGNDSWASSSQNDSGFTSDAAQDDPQKEQSTQRSQRASAWRTQPAQASTDDASPTGGLFQEEVETQANSGESAWDRLRRGGAPSPTPRPAPRRPEAQRREPRQGSTLGDSFTFAESEDERKRAQEQAQKEFDARIQLERQGKDFNEERRW